MPLRCSGPSDAARKVEDIMLQHAGRAGLHVGDRIQPAEPGAEHLQRVLLRHRKTVGPAQRSRRSNITAIRAHITQELSKVQDGIAFSFAPPAIPGRRDLRRRDLHAGRPVRRRRLQFLTDNVNKFLAGGAQAAGTGRRDVPRICPTCRRITWMWIGRRCCARA